MAFELIRPGHQLSLPAGSAINPRVPVKLVAGASGLVVAGIATSGDRPFGMNGQATAGVALVPSQVAAPGDYVTIYEETNIVKAIAGASLGAGAEVGVATTSGAMTPAAAASGFWAVGIAMTPAAAGERFSLYVKPRKV